MTTTTKFNGSTVHTVSVATHAEMLALASDRAAKRGVNIHLVRPGRIVMASNAYGRSVHYVFEVVS